MNELNRLRGEGNDISEAVENLKREVAPDKKLKAIKKISMISMIHNLYSNDSTKIYKGLKLIPGVLHDTGYVALAIPQNRSYIIGKEVRAIGIKTPNTGNINIGICTTLLESKGEGIPAGVTDKNISKVFLFFNRLDESYIVHEGAHMISDRIKSEQRGVRSERLAKLAELLNQRYNGREVGEIFSYLEEPAVDKLAHDIADEENFIALYEIKTGIKMPNLDVAKIKDALRGVSPSEIAGLAEEAIRRGGFFDQESKANIFIEDVKVCVKAANALGALFMDSIIEPMYKNRPSVPLPYQLNLFMLYAYFNSLKAAREGRLNESAEFIKEMITYYFDGKESLSQTIIQAINLSNQDNLFVSQKDLRNIKSYLKNENIPPLLGYFVAAWVEAAEEAIRVHQVEKSKKNGDNSNLSVLSGKKTVRDAI